MMKYSLFPYCLGLSWSWDLLGSLECDTSSIMAITSQSLRDTMPWLLLDSCQVYLHKHKLPCSRMRVPVEKRWDTSTNRQPSPVTELPNWPTCNTDVWAWPARSRTLGSWASLNTWVMEINAYCCTVLNMVAVTWHYCAHCLRIPHF